MLHERTLEKEFRTGTLSNRSQIKR